MGGPWGKYRSNQSGHITYNGRNKGLGGHIPPPHYARDLFRRTQNEAKSLIMTGADEGEVNSVNKKSTKK